MIESILQHIVSWRRVWYAVFLLSLAVVLLLTLMPSSGTEQLFPGQDKVAHATAFCWLFGSGWLGLRKPAPALTLAVALAGYGLLIEVLQSFTGYRSAELLDLLADIFGIALGFVITRSLFANTKTP